VCEYRCSFFVRSQSLPLLSTHSRCRGCLFSLDHTQTHTTVSRTPLDEGSSRRRDLYVTTHSQETNIHAPGRIRTHDPSKRSATDPHFRPRGHWDRHCSFLVLVNTIHCRRVNSAETLVSEHKPEFACHSGKLAVLSKADQRECA
jgi:hypothetical protein